MKMYDNDVATESRIVFRTEPCLIIAYLTLLSAGFVVLGVDRCPTVPYPKQALELPKVGSKH